MRLTRNFVALVALLMVAGYLQVGGCRKTDDGEEPLADLAMALVLEQSVSTFHAVSASITTAGGTASFACASSGTGTLTETDSGTEICWESDLQGCTFTGDDGGSLTLSGSTSLCYAATATITEPGALGLAEAGELSFEGDVTVSGEGPNGHVFPATTCTYALSGTATATTQGGETCTTLTLTGSLGCGLRDSAAGGTITVCAEAEISAE
jgi:hypothetical protein